MVKFSDSMKSIVISLDDVTLARAEQKSLELGTSIGEVAAAYLRRWAESDDTQRAREIMVQRFARPDWQFAVGPPDDRNQRSARS